MYTISPKTLKEFIEDGSVKLPRFQRKATWKDNKRFELALSVFKNYPLGASILSCEGRDKFLLDGRQRRDTLKAIYEDPEVLYRWGKAYFGIKNNYTAEQIREAFDDGVSEFIELDDGCREGDDASDENPIENTIEIMNENTTDVATHDPIDDLTELKNIIVFAFLEKTNTMSGITASFDFRKYMQDSQIYFGHFYQSDKKTIDGKKLRDRIHEYVKKFPNDWSVKENFIIFISDYGFKDDASRSKFVSRLNESWESTQLKVIYFFQTVDRIFTDRTIGFIETSNITSTDSQKIFNLINTGGTKLTSSEILSAKPKWNQTLKIVSTSFYLPTKRLYDGLELGNVGESKTVKWDIPASLTYYLGNDNAPGGLDLLLRFKENDIASRITAGFQLLSGCFSKGVKKEDVAELADKFDWENYDGECNKIKSFLKAIESNKYLGVLRSWGKCLGDIVSYGPALNYFFLAFRSFEELGEPSGFSGVEKKIFDKNLFILLDQTFYYYLCNMWKGSSDSTIAKNIEAFENHKGRDEKGLMSPIEPSAWENLLKSIFETNKLNNKDIEKGDLAPLVWYYTIIKDIRGKGADDPGEIDHIMPQANWNSVNVENKEALQNSLFNLAPLPKSLNSPKSNNTLTAIKSQMPDLAKQISYFEEIPFENFEKYSQIGNYTDLKAHRERLYLDAFTQIREEILKNA